MKRYSLLDQLATTFAFLGFSLPTFLTFSVQLGWLPFIYSNRHAPTSSC